MSENSVKEEIAALEAQVFEQTLRLQALRQNYKGDEVANYQFATLQGEVSLLDLFAHHHKLLVIHNMGQGCRYCTLWADGFNGLLQHLESALSVVLVSKDTPQVQRRFANERGWRFRLASHGGGDYIREQAVQAGTENMPGAVVYAREGDTIRRTNDCVFGPGDLYCSAWHMLALAGLGEAQWTPQFNYWTRPAQLDDGGANLLV
jgi:predicted dithiol-disulfide oxidoreductase (DUF899 family)